MKAIIFDCDGTLVDSEMYHFQAWARALEKQGYSFTLDEYFSCVGIPINITAAFLANKVGKPCAEELQNDKHAFFKSSIQKGVPPIAGTFSFLQKLIAEQSRFNYKLAIASGAPKEEIMLYLRHLQVEHVFDVILSGRDDLHHYNDPEGVNKPKPYIYLEAAKRLGVHPSDCIAIEDSHTGLMAGSKAGCVTVAIPTSFSLDHDFSASHLQIASLHSYTVDQFLSTVRNIASTRSSFPIC